MTQYPPKYVLQQVDCVLLSVSLETVTFDTVQEVFEQVYLTMKTGPVSLFLCEQDLMALDASTKENIAKETGDDLVWGNLTQIANKSVGRLVDLVVLPKTKPHTLILGFFQG